jgi:ELWxxDGT repeat protein
MNFVGPIGNINQALDGVIFMPSLYYNGFDARLIITVDDMNNFGLGGPKLDSQTIRFVVNPVNDAPFITMPADSGGARFFVVKEGSVIKIDGAKYVPPSLSSLFLALSPNSSVGVGADVNWQTGLEPFRFMEPRPSAAGSAANRPGYLDWSSRVVADIRAGPRDSNPLYFTPYKGYMYYQADDGVHGEELWRDDGGLSLQDGAYRLNKEGQQLNIASALFADLLPGSRSSAPSHLATHGDYLYFSAGGLDTNWMIPSGHSDNCNSFRQSSFDASVFFAVSNSTQWNPSKTYDCPLGYHWATTEEGYAHFTSHADTHIEEYWHAGGGVIIDNYASLDLKVRGVSIRDYDEMVYYDQCGWEGFIWAGKERVHFRFKDSYQTGAYKHAGKHDSYRPDIDPLSNTQRTTARFAGIICIVSSSFKDSVSNDRECSSSISSQSGCVSASAGSELWRTDGTLEGTIRTDDIYKGSSSSAPSYLTSFGPYLYFAATDDTVGQGRNLYRTLGGLDQAEVILKMSYNSVPGTVIPPKPASRINPEDLTVSGTSLFFAATEKSLGRELCVISTSSGIVDAANTAILVVDIVPGGDSSSPKGFTSSDHSTPFVLFQAYTAASGTELWRSDGSALGTSLVMDICPGKGSSNPRYITYFNSLFYFQADDCVHGIELWSSTGFLAGTSLLLDIRVGTADSFPSFLTVLPSSYGGEYLLFAATDGYLVPGIHDSEGALMHFED